MASLRLIIGNKNYSSWSLRVWLLLRHFELAFEEIRIPLDTPEFDSKIGHYSPTLKVPVLIHGELRLAESLAICEYLQEYFSLPAWPLDLEVRAQARAVSQEMASGFAALRAALPMNCRASARRVNLSIQVSKDIQRITDIWTEARQRYAVMGNWLFGEFSIADAMYMPVASRFSTYGIVPATQQARAYLNQLLIHPGFQEWVSAAALESEFIEAEEVGR